MNTNSSCWWWGGKLGVFLMHPAPKSPFFRELKGARCGRGPCYAFKANIRDPPQAPCRSFPAKEFWRIPYRDWGFIRRVLAVVWMFTLDDWPLFKAGHSINGCLQRHQNEWLGTYWKCVVKLTRAALTVTQPYLLCVWRGQTVFRVEYILLCTDDWSTDEATKSPACLGQDAASGATIIDTFGYGFCNSLLKYNTVTR